MKKVKIAVTILFFIILGLYLTFLFVIPKLASLDSTASYIEQIISKNIKTDLKFNDLKIKTSWDFSICTNIRKIDLYKNNEKFAQINNLKIKIFLIPFIFKQYQISEISAEKVLANIKKEDFIFLANSKNKQLKFSEKIPSLKIDTYRISLLENTDNYTVKGKNFQISPLSFNKRLKLSADGKLIINKNEHVNYNLKVITNNIPKFENNISNDKIQEVIEILKNFEKYKVYFILNSDVILNKDKNVLKIKGFSNINDIKFSYENKRFLPSNIELKFNDSQIDIISKVNIDKKNHIQINGNFNHSKNKSLKLKVLGDDIDIADISSIIKIAGKSFGIKELQYIDLKGKLDADFDISSDLKNIISKGYLKIQNGSVYHKVSKILLNDINTNIDFSDNIIKIKADAKLQSNPIKILGSIDKKANANIKIIGDNVNPADIAKLNTKLTGYNISGTMNISAILKGQLKTLSSNINLAIKNLNILNSKNAESLKITSADISAIYNKKLYSNAKFFNINYSPDIQNSILLPKLNLNITDNILTIEKTSLWLNNIKSELSGEIININKTPEINNLRVIIPNYTTVPIKGYQGSKLSIKGDLKASGLLSKPTINGYFSIPTLNVPSLSMLAKDLAFKVSSDSINLTCPYIHLGSSAIKLAADIDTEISKGIVIKNIDIFSSFINLDELENLLKRQKEDDITIQAGKLSAETIKLKGLQVENINCKITSKKNMIYLRNIRGEAYTGEIAGDVNYDKSKIITWAKLQGRNLSARLAIPALTNHKDDISGKLDFDGSISFSGSTPQEVRKSLSGNVKFQILNGKMGVLGKLEHLLYAQNIIADSILKASLNLVTKAVTAKNTGVYKYMQGNIVMKKGIADIKFIKTTGPSMSLFINGKYYIPENLSVMTILGRISNDVVSVLGPIGEFTVEKAISAILKKQAPITSISYFTEQELKNYNQLPALTPKTEFKTKSFRVLINGDPYKQTSVQSFEWLIQPKD